MAMCEGISLTFSRPSWCDPDRAPGGMPLAKRDDPLFDLGVDLVWAGLWLVRALYPPIDGLAAHPIGDRRLADGQAVSDDGEDRVITLFHFAELHERSAHLLALSSAQTGGGWVSRISRYCVTDQPLLI